VRAALKKIPKRFKWPAAMGALTLFQLISFTQIVLARGGFEPALALIFIGYMILEWLYCLTARLAAPPSSQEIEIIAFFLSGIGLAVCGSIDTSYALKQLIAIAAGASAYLLLAALIKNLSAAVFLRIPMAIAALGILAFNLIAAQTVNGSLNWLKIGSFSVQPSEFVKVAFIFVGAVTLDKLQSTKSLAKYAVFSIACVGLLFLMRDFGTALIFFFTFILIAFMRSGDMRSIILISTGALLGAMLAVYFKPYVAERFSTYRHIWENMDTGGYQQTRVLIYSASGGLLGLGIGQGKLRQVYAASTDLVFGMICEEWGLLLALLIVAAYAVLAVYCVKAAKTAGSSYYSIACVAAAGMLLFQTALNIFGITDLLPLTGVTLPFISRGGSSVIGSWALIAFIKSAGFRFKAAPQPEKADIPISREARAGRGAV